MISVFRLAQRYIDFTFRVLREEKRKEEKRRKEDEERKSQREEEESARREESTFASFSSGRGFDQHRR